MLELLAKKGPGPDFREEKHNKTTTTKKSQPNTKTAYFGLFLERFG